uniref:Cytoplasmic tRNA 2-thiolation protein 1 C-terminal domain-containing protein n=1 Tax=Aegilops tauschii subsp. strangulata TaxID=200361 RepID=A0A453PNA2_AEGTS
MPEQGTCERCGYISSQKLCKACVLLDGLNRGLPKLGIGRTAKVGAGTYRVCKENTATLAVKWPLGCKRQMQIY